MSAPPLAPLAKVLGDMIRDSSPENQDRVVTAARNRRLVNNNWGMFVVGYLLGLEIDEVLLRGKTMPVEMSRILAGQSRLLHQLHRVPNDGSRQLLLQWAYKVAFGSAEKEREIVEV